MFERLGIKDIEENLVYIILLIIDIPYFLQIIRSE